MTTNRLQNRVAKIEAISNPQSFLVEMLPGELELDLELRLRAIGRPVASSAAHGVHGDGYAFTGPERMVMRSLLTSNTLN